MSVAAENCINPQNVIIHLREPVIIYFDFIIVINFGNDRAIDLLSGN